MMSVHLCFSVSGSRNATIHDLKLELLCKARRTSILHCPIRMKELILGHLNSTTRMMKLRRPSPPNSGDQYVKRHKALSAML